MGAVVADHRPRSRPLAGHAPPLIIISASGGARMMEGIVSLIQLAKISAGLARLDDAGIPYISLMTDPTTGGVTASSPCSAISTSPSRSVDRIRRSRVIEQTIRQKLPEGFQRSEFLLEHGSSTPSFRARR